MPDEAHRTTPHPAGRQPPPPALSPPLRVVVADDNPVVRAGLTALLSGREDITVVAEAQDGHQACEATHQHRPDVVLLDVRMPGVDGISALPYLAGMAPVIMLTYSRESEIVQEALRRGASGYLVHGEFTANQLITAVRDIKQGRPHFTPTAADALLARFRQDPTPPGPPLPDGLGRSDATAYGNAKRSERHKNPQLAELPANVPAPHTPPSLIPRKVLSQMQRSVGQSSSGWTTRRPAAPDRSRFQLSTREAEIMDLIASGMNNQQIAATCFISEKTVKNHINRIFAKLHSTSRSEAAAKWLGTAPGSDRGAG